MPHIFERAPTGRAKCRGCGQAIAAGAWRFGERLPNPFAEGEGVEMTHWFHPRCAAFKRPEPLAAFLTETTDPIEDREFLLQHVQAGMAHRRLPRVDVVSRAPSGRAMCRACRAAIEKGAWRVGLVFYEDGRFAPSGYIHLTCASSYLETTDLAPRIQHFSAALTDADLADIRRVLDGVQN
jgi:ribosomal protein L37AE/L43A